MLELAEQIQEQLLGISQAVFLELKKLREPLTRLSSPFAPC